MGISGVFRSKDKTQEQFEHCLARLKNFAVFNMREHSRQFLYQLWCLKPVEFELLIMQLERQQLFLAPHHFDTAIASLTTQSRLPETMWQELQVFLDSCPDFEQKIEQLFFNHAADLLYSARDHHLLHHSLPHALEMARRVDVILDELGIWTGNDKLSRLLRVVTRLMVRFHDHEQKEKNPYSSVEEVTAARVLNWLVQEFRDAELRPLIMLTSLMAERIIVLGTTMIYSPTATMDVSELFLRLHDLAKGTRLLDDDCDEASFKNILLRDLNRVMLVVGVCDKNPSALYSVVANQANESTLSTVSILNSHGFHESMLDVFFKHNGFIAPYGMIVSDAINQQTFLMSLIPHLSMRCELAQADEQSHAHAFVAFISEMRDYCLIDAASLRERFDQQWVEKQMHRHLHALFFAVTESGVSGVDKEQKFSQSQQSGLCFVSARLDNQRLINTEVPLIDAMNIQALSVFYSQLEQDLKAQLMRELTFVVVMQAGHILAMESDLNVDLLSDPKSGFYQKKPEFKSIGFFSGHQISGRSMTERVLPLDTSTELEVPLGL